MAAMNSVAPNTATGIFISAAPANAMTTTAAISVAAITAMPPPCGVGIRCEERAFGLASATRMSSGRIAHVRTPDNSAAGTAAANDSRRCELAILSAWKVARSYLGTSIGAVPRAAFSALNIQTSPPTAPTMKDTAPKSSEMLTPSLATRPA